ncbi:MAG: site-2 protease family protein [Ruminococcaceae bacterium]|nr:site-2 protease family protein [Oscillospiraceae bacterium]
MFRLGNFDIVGILVRAIAVLLAISVHEMAHGYGAYLLGDKTAKAMGRLSLNPLRHLDPIGALCLLLFGFGWAKPVVVAPVYFKKPKRDMALTALAGPLSNFVMAYITLWIYKGLFATGFLAFGGFWAGLINQFLITFVVINIGLGVFNLLPIPPLDGSKVFLPLLPNRLFMDIMRYEHLGWLILMVALGLGVLDPIMSVLRQGVLEALIFLTGGI